MLDTHGAGQRWGSPRELPDREFLLMLLKHVPCCQHSRMLFDLQEGLTAGPAPNCRETRLIYTASSSSCHSWAPSWASRGVNIQILLQH